MLSEWKRIFEPDPGVWLETGVLHGDPGDWRALLDWACQKYQTTYFEDGTETILARIALTLERVGTVTALLRTDVAGFSALAHFVSTNEIELDVLPESVASEAKAAAVFKLMTGTARLLRKDVILAAEHGSLDRRQRRGMAVCLADSGGNLSLGDVEPERVRCRS